MSEHKETQQDVINALIIWMADVSAMQLATFRDYHNPKLIKYIDQKMKDLEEIKAYSAKIQEQELKEKEND